MRSEIKTSFYNMREKSGRQTIVYGLTSVVVALSCAVSDSHAAEKYKGKATNLAGNFNYGAVTFTVSGSTMKNLIIEGVTTIGCGGYKNVVVPSVKIRGAKFSASYQPIPGINDIIKVSGTIRSGKVSGTFSEGPLCYNSGKFTAKRQ